MGRPPKPPEERLVTLSVRVPKASLQLLDRIVDGEVQYLRQRHLPTRGVSRSTAFRTVWELGELEYVLQRVTLWVTRKTNRYTVEQAAELLGWRPDVLRGLLLERGVDAEGSPPPSAEAPKASGLDTRFLD
jgi:hypothetical protein